MKKNIYILFLLFVLSACERETAYLACDQVETIKEFPVTIHEEELSPLPIDVPGCVDITVADSFLICKYVDGDYFWKVYSLNDCGFISNLFRRGHGKNETADLFNNEELNTLSAGSFWCGAKNKMVEAMLLLNQLHIYTLDGSWSKTLNIGGEPMNLYEIDGQYRRNIVEQFSEVKGNDDYIVALYLGGKETDLMENKVKSSLLIFD